MPQGLTNWRYHMVFKLFAVLLLWSIILLLLLYAFESENWYYDQHNEVHQQQNILQFLWGGNILENRQTDLESYDLGKNGASNMADIIAAIESEQPSLPFRFWQEHKAIGLQLNASCALYPSIIKLRYHNKYWQTFENSHIVMQLYSAYYDNRTNTPVLRLLAMVNHTEQPHFPPTYCQLWYAEQSTPLFAKVNEFRLIWQLRWGVHTGQQYPYLISCALPVSAQLPQVVSLVAHKCENATNSLRINHTPPTLPKRQFAVCVKGLDYPNTDISARLVEWIELQLLLGADKIFIYQLQAHPNVRKVLQYYQQRGKLHVQPLTLASGEPSTPQLQHFLLGAQLFNRRLNELIPFNDCFYRNINRYEYVALQDIDEVIMPLGNHTQWSDLVALAATKRNDSCNGFASYCFRNVYFPQHAHKLLYSTKVPRYMYMLQHVRRSREHLSRILATKCFHRTDEVLTLHNHFAISWLSSICKSYSFEPHVAQLQHYREPDKQEQLENNIEDKSVWRYKKALLDRSMKALRELGFVGVS